MNRPPNARNRIIGANGKHWAGHRRARRAAFAAIIVANCGGGTPAGPGSPGNGQSPRVTQLAVPARGPDVSARAAVWANFEGRLTWAVGTRVFATDTDSIIAEVGLTGARDFGATPRVHDLWVAWIEFERATGENEVVVYDLASHSEWRYPNAAGVFLDLAVGERGVYWITPAAQVSRFNFVSRSVEIVQTPQPAHGHLAVSGPWLTYIAPTGNTFAYHEDAGDLIDLGATDADPAISTAFAVRRVRVDGRWTLWSYDLSTGEDIAIEGAHAERFDVGGDRLVYEVFSGPFPKEIWVHNLRSGERIQIADTNRFLNFEAKVSGHRVVWTQSDGSPPIPSAVMAELAR